MTPDRITASVAAAYDRRKDQVAFTLIELLVVLSIIALIATGLGVALADSGGAALSTAQSSLASLVGSARAQAAVHQTNARLYIYGSRPPAGEPEKFLRLLQVFREEPADSGNFVPSGAPVLLPRGVYVVPASTAGLLAAGVMWPTNPAPVSAFATLQPQPLRPAQPPGTPFGGAIAGYYIEFSPDGTPTPATAKLAIATASVANNLPQFNQPGAVRGLLIRANGAVTAVNEPEGF